MQKTSSSQLKAFLLALTLFRTFEMLCDFINKKEYIMQQISAGGI